MEGNKMSDFDEVTTSRRTYELDNGNKLYAERKDPFGFIELHLDKGPLPERLLGKYTSYDEADRAIQQYLSARSREVLQVINA
jgi:hypothetical protein